MLASMRLLAKVFDHASRYRCLPHYSRKSQIESVMVLSTIRTIRGMRSRLAFWRCMLVHVVVVAVAGWDAEREREREREREGGRERGREGEREK